MKDKNRLTVLLIRSMGNQKKRKKTSEKEIINMDLYY